MKLKDLQNANFDPNIFLYKENQKDNSDLLWGLDLKGICGFESPIPSHLFFIKDIASLKTIDFKLAALISPKYCLISSETLNAGLKNLEIKKVLDDFNALLISACPAKVISNLTQYFYNQRVRPFLSFVDGRQFNNCNIHPSAKIAQGVFIGENVSIGANVTLLPGVTILGDCRIGENSIVFPNAVIYPNVTIGANCYIHASTVIGSDGFGYWFESGKHWKLWHIGGVNIGPDVEIGASSSIDGGTFQATEIGKGTKIDNQVQIGHNCIIGQHVIICGDSAVGGSTEIGDYSVLGGKAGTGHGLKIGAQSKIAGGALVNCDWPEKSVIGGHPARKLNEWMRGLAFVRTQSLKKER